MIRFITFTEYGHHYPVHVNLDHVVRVYEKQVPEKDGAVGGMMVKQLEIHLTHATEYVRVFVRDPKEVDQILAALK